MSVDVDDDAREEETVKTGVGDGLTLDGLGLGLAGLAARLAVRPSRGGQPPSLLVFYQVMAIVNTSTMCHFTMDIKIC